MDDMAPYTALMQYRPSDKPVVMTCYPKPHNILERYAAGERHFVDLDDDDDCYYDLTGADLRGAVFCGSRFVGDFTNANLEGADFSGCAIKTSIFTGAKLTDANFEDTAIDGVDFTGANLTGARFEGAAFSGYIFSRGELPYN